MHQLCALRRRCRNNTDLDLDRLHEKAGEGFFTFPRFCVLISRRSLFAQRDLHAAVLGLSHTVKGVDPQVAFTKGLLRNGAT